jgi:hypothetical protein
MDMPGNYTNNEIRVRFVGKSDKDGKDYYFARCSTPANVDLSNAVLFFFPDEGDEEFGGDLVIKIRDSRQNPAHRNQEQGAGAPQKGGSPSEPPNTAA